MNKYIFHITGVVSCNYSLYLSAKCIYENAYSQENTMKYEKKIMWTGMRLSRWTKNNYCCCPLWLTLP